jgi:endonuclease/exonuclease/phosphatase family metal-dependent hydrolase
MTAPTVEVPMPVRRAPLRRSLALLAGSCLAVGLLPVPAIAAAPAPARVSGVVDRAVRPPAGDVRPAPSTARPTRVTVMTRNIYLGADLGIAFGASGIGDLFAKAGLILDQVAASNFPVRAKGLAQEIVQRRPDIVALQEAALWRTGPVDFGAVLSQQPAAKKVYQDFIAILRSELRKAGTPYRLVAEQDEFDFETPADTDGNPATGTSGADMDGRLTMRDAVLVRADRRIRVKDVVAEHYSAANSYQVSVTGLTVTVKRGWVAMSLRVGRSPWFRFVNTHLESFDPRTVVPSLRARQAQELVDAVSATRLPLIVVGDLNSDVPGLVPGDEQAMQVMYDNGFVDLGTTTPMSCCIKDSYDLTTGSVDDFDHRVDQILTDTPKQVRPLRTWVTGRTQVNGYWNSDHAGTVARLLVRP